MEEKSEQEYIKKEKAKMMIKVRNTGGEIIRKI